MRAATWAAAALAVAALTIWGVTDAVRDLSETPLLVGVLRLVVEAVAGALVVGYCTGKSRRAAAPDAVARDGAGQREDSKARQRDGN